MNLEEILCKTFCDGIEVKDVGAGLAVSTALEDHFGDRITFYVVRDQATGLYRLEDDGSLVPTLLAAGSNVTEGQRRRVFDAILRQTGAEYDEDAGELRSALLSEAELPLAAMKFMATLSRVLDPIALALSEEPISQQPLDVLVSLDELPVELVIKGRRRRRGNGL